MLYSPYVLSLDARMTTQLLCKRVHSITLAAVDILIKVCVVLSIASPQDAVRSSNVTTNVTKMHQDVNMTRVEIHK